MHRSQLFLSSYVAGFWIFVGRCKSFFLYFSNRYDHVTDITWCETVVVVCNASICRLQHVNKHRWWVSDQPTWQAQMYAVCTRPSCIARCQRRRHHKISSSQGECCTTLFSVVISHFSHYHDYHSSLWNEMCLQCASLTVSTMHWFTGTVLCCIRL